MRGFGLNVIVTGWGSVRGSFEHDNKTERECHKRQRISEPDERLSDSQ
jgi:hypothetical protein